MYAIIKTGGKQYRVSQGDTVKVEKIPVNVGDTITLEDVLLVSGEDGVKLGNPVVSEAVVEVEVVSQGRHRKIRVFKKKRRKGYKRLTGHRQEYTEIRIKDIKI